MRMTLSQVWLNMNLPIVGPEVTPRPVSRGSGFMPRYWRLCSQQERYAHPMSCPIRDQAKPLPIVGMEG